MIIAATFQKLEGSEHHFGAYRLAFDKSPNRWPAVMKGGEGFAAPVHISFDARRPQDGHAYILKVYGNPGEERRIRTVFLANLKLGHLPEIPYFEAAPQIPVHYPIDLPAEGRITLEGYLAPRMAGETLSELFSEGWDAPRKARASLARQLCDAVAVLEQGGGLVHGDLAPKNLMIQEPRSDNARLRLIDFDGFHHRDIPPVPVGPGGRTWGTPGYRAHCFKPGDRDSFVTSDRVALAILVLEIIAREPGDEDTLPDEWLLDQRDIDKRAPQLPDEVVRRWPEGWDLARRAVKAADPSAAPSPAELRRAIKDWLQGNQRRPIPGPPSGVPVSSTQSREVFTVLVRARRSEDRHVRFHRPAGTFAPVDSAMEWLFYEHHEGVFHLSGNVPPGQPDLVIRNGGPQADAERHKKVDTRVPAGSVLVWDDFEIYL